MVIDFPWWFYLVLVWTLIWKGIGAWKAARNNQSIWFISFFVFNTFGILPLVYLQWFQQDWNVGVSKKSVRKKAKKRISKKKFPSLPK